MPFQPGTKSKRMIGSSLQGNKYGYSYQTTTKVKIVVLFPTNFIVCFLLIISSLMKQKCRSSGNCVHALEIKGYSKFLGWSSHEN